MSYPPAPPRDQYTPQPASDQATVPPQHWAPQDQGYAPQYPGHYRAPQEQPHGYGAAQPGHGPWTQPKNGLGIAALCCGLIGILMGLIPILFLASAALGILAIVFGLIGINRARRREATNRGMSIGGLATGIIALALAAVGVSLIIGGVHRLDNDLNNFNVGPNAHAQHQVNNQERDLIRQGGALWK